jgi:alpha-L-fucosidase
MRQMPWILLVSVLMAVGFGRLHGQQLGRLQPADKRTEVSPTAGRLTPEQIAQQWVDASRAYEPERRKLLADVQRTTAAGPFRDDWESLATARVPDWFADAKFGIFLHWGVFSVPAFGSEWYSRNMYLQGDPDFAHHRATYGSQAEFGYKDFIPQFRMQHFDPAAWASLFRSAGARYVVPVAEHHDGFALYNSALSDWTAVKMGPKRDLVGDLEKAVHADGLRFGVSSHRAEHDWFFDGGRSFRSDVNDPRYAAFYGPAEPRMLQGAEDADLQKDYTYVSDAFRKDWLARSAELVERYHPDLMYFDWWVGQADLRETQRTFAAFYYDTAAAAHQPVVLFTKYDNMAAGAGVLDVERGAMSAIQVRPWQTDTSISNASWGYVEHDTYKPASELIDELVDVVSKNGNLLLNIGPRADGTIPEQAQEILRAMGRWLDTNGEAIYGSRPWTQFGEGPTAAAVGTFQDKQAKPYTAEDFRFTTRAGKLYAIELGCPLSIDGHRRAVIHALAVGKAKVRSVVLLGDERPLQWQQMADGLVIELPEQAAGSIAWTYRIELQQQ